jgi:hypothetical protein
VEEIRELELGDGMPEGKLQEPFYGVRMSGWVQVPKMDVMVALI